MPPGVTIVIPTYNRERLLPRAVDSVLAQTYPCSLVIVDDGSTDATLEMLQRYAGSPAVRVVPHAVNRGQAAARNTGIDNVPAGTTYFGILDSDDALVPDAIETLVAVFEGSPDTYSQVFGWCRDMDTGEPTGVMPYREGPLTYDDALAGRFQGEFWQLASLEVLGDLRFEERARGGASGVWWRMLRRRPAWLVADDVREYDRSGTDRVSLRGFAQGSAGWTEWAVKAMIDGEIGADMRAQYPRRYSGYLSELAKWAALAGDGATARAASREAVRVAPSLRGLLMVGVAMLPPAGVRRLATAKKTGSRLIEDRLGGPEPWGGPTA
jgi:glycosyltransferase involved in cell wall biosynthesis